MNRSTMPNASRRLHINSYRDGLSSSSRNPTGTYSFEFGDWRRSKRNHVSFYKNQQSLNKGSGRGVVMVCVGRVVTTVSVLVSVDVSVSMKDTVVVLKTVVVYNVAVGWPWYAFGLQGLKARFSRPC